MLNAVKMDFYRMIRTKSLYVVILIFVMMTVISTILCKSEFDDMEIQQDNYETVMQEENNDTVNAGISVILPTKPGEKVTVYDMFYANVKGKEVALFLVIFAVIFSAADFKSGYIKNIGGQTRKRFYLILSKAVSLCIYTVFLFGVFIIAQAVSNQVILGYLKWGPPEEVLPYLGVQLLLHAAFALFIMAVTIIIQNNVISMALAICLCLDLMAVVYSLFDHAAQKIGAEGFHLAEYTATGRIAMLPMALENTDLRVSLVTAAVFIAGSLIICGAVFQKRDIH